MRSARSLVHICLKTLGMLVLMPACALLRSPPKVVTIEERISQLPQDLKLDLKDRRSELRFNEHLVPYIITENDEDAAFLLGVAHAHLRGFQLELLRRASQGRLSERLGPLARNLDHALRIFDFGRASARIEADMPADTKLWMNAFVRGLNRRMLVGPQPFEFSSLGIKAEAWTLRDLITLSRLLGADVNWISWMQALSDESPDLRWRQESALSREGATWENLKKLFQSLSKSGSNSWVLASRKTENGAPLIASDPHVGLVFPNLWFMFGVHSPSIRGVGLGLPGIPFILLGRNSRVAWGGTNMRALSTEFYDVSKLSQKEFTTTKQKIVVRGWPDKNIEIRESRFGPVLSDAKIFNSKSVFSVRWIGHEASDEFSAFYRMNKSRNFEEFHESFRSYGVSAQNFLYADVAGNIAHILALKKPERSENRPETLLVPALDKHRWKSILSASEMPYRWNPGENFLASANNRPDFAPSDLGRAFSPNDRIDRIKSLIGSSKRALSRDDMKEWQLDVHSALSLRAASILHKLFTPLASKEREKLDLEILRKWDGNYHADSRGALIYAALEAEYLARFAKARLPQSRARQFLQSGNVREALVAALESKDAEAKLSAKDLKAVWTSAIKGDLKDFKNWGEKHSEALNHPFSALPLVGSRYRLHSAPASGSFDTLLKRAHAVAPGKTPTTYGATARHVSDLSDADLNEFVLFGGQDGWLGSPAGLSQIPLWTKGTMIRMPLSLDRVRREFPLLTN